MFLTGKEISNSVSKVVPLIVAPFRISTDQHSFLWKLLNVKNVMWNTINDAVCRNCQSTLRSAIYRISWPKIPVQILLIVIDVWLKSLCTVQIGIPSMNSSRYVLSSSSESELSSICMTDHMHASSSIQFRLSTLKQNTFHDSIEWLVPLVGGFAKHLGFWAPAHLQELLTDASSHSQFCSGGHSVHPLFVLENACAPLEFILENSCAGMMMFVLENCCGANMHADAPRKKKENLSEKLLVKGFPYQITYANMLCSFSIQKYWYLHILTYLTLHERV